ncbi:MAG: hypothetical protein ABEL51_06095 [Salinibacter sp.]
MNRYATILLLAGLLAGMGMGTAHAQIYVDNDASGNNDGSSWTDAYTDLQSALSAATSSDEIWIAEGVYTPASGTDQSASFVITGGEDGLGLYGGFSGDESSRSERDPGANPTILSGDLEGDDTTTNGVTVDASDISGSNSNHVLFLDGTSSDITNSTVIDGVTVTAGQANGNATDGGGIYCTGGGSGNECSPTFQNLVIPGNHASGDGGGMYNDGANGGQSHPTLTNVLFYENSADGFGGGMRG